MKTITLIFSLFISFNALAAEKTIILDVPGMFCPTCPITVKKSLLKVEGVQVVKTSLKDKTAIVIFDDQAVEVEDLTFTTENAGYPSTLKK
ncbi:MAG: periplasmic mercuric ion binding protein [Thiomicrorhabdus sp.]|nr:MAG: periplasmic mercuric ion binding protein [Thiomicrorhabdus sp.]